MSLSSFFKKVFLYLREIASESESSCRFALAGGLLASYYRKAPRGTNDIDIVLFSDGDPKELAQKIVRHFGLREQLVRRAELEGGPMFAIKRKSTPVCIVVGRPLASLERSGVGIGLDILLPSIPWVERALERARYNLIDFGFGPVPCLTVEDLLISKVYSFQNQKTRFMDLDDIRSIFESGPEMNLAYLAGELKRLGLDFPKEVHPFLPKVLRNR